MSPRSGRGAALARLVCAALALLLLSLEGASSFLRPLAPAAAVPWRLPRRALPSRALPLVPTRSAPVAVPAPPAPGSRPTGPDRLGVLFLNLGGPEKLDDVEGFLYNLFADPDIIRLPPGVNLLQKPIAKYISKTRSTQAKKAYASIGGGSPIVRYTTEQAGLVQKELTSRGWDAKCYFAMRYWNPMTDEVYICCDMLCCDIL
jgi:ferrochelatase